MDSGEDEREEDSIRQRKCLMTSSIMKHLIALNGSAKDYEWYQYLCDHDSISCTDLGLALSDWYSARIERNF